jgi:predicted phage terminase large subunit-like protein
MSLQQSQNQVSSQAAARELLQRRMARRSVLPFTTYTKPDYEVNWHHEVLCDHLDRFVAREVKRLMVFMPQRQGKSELVSRRLPAYIFGRNPKASVMGCSYGADLSSRMNRDVQRIIDSPEYLRVFPDTRLYGRNVRTTAQSVFLRNSDIFEIVDYLGVYRSAGVGGGITGMGFDYGIIDDPIKDPKDAESAVVRESLFEWYTGAFWTRQAPNACILLTMTRWHEDDLAGRLLKMAEEDPNADQWTVLKLPGICEDPTPEYEQREKGEPLWPARADVSYYEAMKANNARQYESMCQQNPTAREGNMFKVGKLEIVDAAPVNARRARFWDKGATDGGGDFTAGVKVSIAPNGQIYIEDVERGQWGTDERDSQIKQTAQLDGKTVLIGGEQEPGSAGKDAALAFIRLLAGFSVRVNPSSGSKELRADPLSSQVNAGNVKLVKGSWNKAFIEELRQFPFGKHDDQVDAASGAFNLLSKAADPSPVRSYSSVGSR